MKAGRYIIPDSAIQTSTERIRGKSYLYVEIGEKSRGYIFTVGESLDDDKMKKEIEDEIDFIFHKYVYNVDNTFLDESAIRMAEWFEENIKEIK